ncbi:hypothetical protein GALL_541370 [mine drainage metagenome]|uniref:Uncharacterized protein n=1 Tax=mine drainage metagenome TaxID=410659 RepID=A0A1J5P929_9ZZZZ
MTGRVQGLCLDQQMRIAQRPEPVTPAQIVAGEDGRDLALIACTALVAPMFQAIVAIDLTARDLEQTREAAVARLVVDQHEPIVGPTGVHLIIEADHGAALPIQSLDAFEIPLGNDVVHQARCTHLSTTLCDENPAVIHRPRGCADLLQPGFHPVLPNSLVGALTRGGHGEFFCGGCRGKRQHTQQAGQGPDSKQSGTPATRQPRRRVIRPGTVQGRTSIKIPRARAGGGGRAGQQRAAHQRAETC